MTFADLVAGNVVFLEANTFVYHFAPGAMLSRPRTRRSSRRARSASGPSLTPGSMIELIEQHRVELAELCRKYRVKTLEVFGSATDGTWDAARSDLDFLQCR